MVESQQQIATVPLVSTLEKQAILEEMLESTKPAYPANSAGLHYLLSTPFRYPPLKYGSRFGSRHEPSLFYGSEKVMTVLAELAYYRFVFWQGMSTPPSNPIRTSHSLLKVSYKSKLGLKLQNMPFLAHEKALIHPSQYTNTQALGALMRANGIQGFQYLSARDPAHGINIGLFTPKAFAEKKPQTIDPWECELNMKQVLFYEVATKETHLFPSATFEVKGRIPVPA
jgi:hypothetical protein